VKVIHLLSGAAWGDNQAGDDGIPIRDGGNKY
jgi:hypothetical protein